ncbi:MAG: sodium:solute symporter family protein [Thermoguttaceae bacterium]|jgi:Na+/proline symporter
MGTRGAGFGFRDWLVLVGYFVACTAFGLWVSRRVRTSGGYFLGERKFPWWIMIGQSFGTGTHAENPVSQAGATFQFGFATIWYQWKNMLITPFYWLMAPWYRRSERTTIAEIVEDRYGRSLALVYTLYALAVFVMCQGVMLKGAGKIISVATGGGIISPNGVVAALTVAFLLYSFFGGLVAAAYTDFVQGFLIIALSFMLIPAGLEAVGGFAGMRESLSGRSVAEYARRVEAEYADRMQKRAAAAAAGESPKPPAIPGDGRGTAGFFELYNEASGVDAFTILMLTLNGLIGITAQPHTLTMNATGRSERAGRVGQTYGSMVKRFCTIGWALTGLIVAALVIRQTAYLDDKEKAFGYACQQLLGPGWIGLMVSCVVAANMSACSNLMVNAGALFTRNIYKEYVHPAAGDRQLLLVGRCSGLGLTLGSVGFALLIGEVLQAFLFAETAAALMGIIIVGGFLWKRGNRYGAGAALLAAFGVYYVLNFLMAHPAPGDPAKLEMDTLRSVWAQLQTAWSHGQVWQFLHTRRLLLIYEWKPVPYAWATLAGFACFIVVSLVTRREQPERIAQFFDNQDRSTDREGLPDGRVKPLAAERGQELLLLDAPGWFTARRWQGCFRRYREDLVGFVLAWGVVALLVLAAWGLMQIGRH